MEWDVPRGDEESADPAASYGGDDDRRQDDMRPRVETRIGTSAEQIAAHVVRRVPTAASPDIEVHCPRDSDSRHVDSGRCVRSDGLFLEISRGLHSKGHRCQTCALNERSQRSSLRFAAVTNIRCMQR